MATKIGVFDIEGPIVTGAPVWRRLNIEIAGVSEEEEKERHKIWLNFDSKSANEAFCSWMQPKWTDPEERERRNKIWRYEPTKQSIELICKEQAKHIREGSLEVFRELKQNGYKTLAISHCPALFIDILEKEHGFKFDYKPRHFGLPGFGFEFDERDRVTGLIPSAFYHKTEVISAMKKKGDLQPGFFVGDGRNDIPMFKLFLELGLPTYTIDPSENLRKHSSYPLFIQKGLIEISDLRAVLSST
jgi:phosphoglycolate phosphatase-like HAD superfamily hydrolase